MQRWIEFRTAYQVAKLGTVTAAAEALGVHRATVNRHVDALEDDLGTKLFQRHGRGYVLTETGAEFLRVAQKAHELLADFEGRTRAGHVELAGEVIVSARSAFAGFLMPPIIEFRKEYPKTRVTFIAQDALVKLEYGEAHVALYGGPKPVQADYVVQPFHGLRMGLYAHSDYVARKGLPSSRAEFAEHEFVGIPEFAGQIPFESWLMRNVPEDCLILKASHPRIAHEATLGGLAIGFLPEYYARGKADLHEVVAPRSDWSPAVWLVTHVDLHRTRKVQAMLRCIQDAHPKYGAKVSRQA